jgi:hypothetical protein
MSNLNNIKIETLTDKQLQVCYAIKTMVDSEEIELTTLGILVEKLCDLSESIDLRANLLQ